MTSTIGKDENTSILKRTRLGDENSNPNEDNVDVILPNRNFTYHEPDKDDETNNQYMVVSKNHPINDSFLSYTNYNTTDKSGGIEWISRDENLLKFEENGRKTIDLLDPGYVLALKHNPDDSSKEYNTNISTYLLNSNYEWVSLHACVSDIGLNQIAWNTNENYNILESNNSNNTLKIKNNDLDKKLKCRIYYINKDEELKYKDDTIENLTTSKTELKDVFKVNSAEITKGINKGDIEFYFEKANLQNNGIKNLNLYLKGESNNTCFDFNQDYFENPSFNSFLNETNGKIDNTDNDGDTLIGTVSKTNFVETSGKETQNNTLKNLLEKNVKYELEGGNGRKAVLETNENKELIISNGGYLYNLKDELRFKNSGDLRDNYIFKIESESEGLENNNSSSEYLQEFIKSGAGKSNTIKRAFAAGELFVAKTLQISGSVKGYLLIRLIKLKNIFDSTVANIAQQTIKEVYYYKRDNINDTFDINTVYENGTELYIDIQKIIRTDDNTNDDDDRSTLNFSLNGILYNSNPSQLP